MKYFMLIRNKVLGSNNDCNFVITKSLKILKLNQECKVRDIKNKTSKNLIVPNFYRNQHTKFENYRTILTCLN